MTTVSNDESLPHNCSNFNEVPLTTSFVSFLQLNTCNRIKTGKVEISIRLIARHSERIKVSNVNNGGGAGRE
jgi:hypothetical protein